MDVESLLDVLKDIRKILSNIQVSLLGQKVEVEIIQPFGYIMPTDFVYERVSSTLENPVPPRTENYLLLDWNEPERTGRPFFLVAVGSDQHDNSYYRWVVDDITLPISGPARAGSIFNPLVFPRPILVRRYVRLFVSNFNDVPYPNNNLNLLSDLVPYEGVIYGYWGRI